MLFLFDADELIERSAALAALKILEVNNGSPARILADITGRVLSADLDPAGIKLGFEQVLGDGIIEYIKSVFAAELHKLEIVIVIEKLNAELLCGGGNFADALNSCVPAVGAGASLLGKIGHGNEFTADFGIIRKRLLGVFEHIIIRHMG